MTRTATLMAAALLAAIPSLALAQAWATQPATPSGTNWTPLLNGHV